MEKEKKKGKGLVILLIILVLLLLGTLGFGGYKYMELQKAYNVISDKYEKTDKKLNETSKNLDQATKTVEDIDKNYITYNHDYRQDGYRIYAEGYMGRVIGYDDQLYFINSGGASYWTVLNCANEITEGAKFKEKQYSCSDNEYASEDEGKVYAKKLDLKESDIYKVVIMNYPASSDAQFTIFFIYKSGEVKASHTGESPVAIKSLKGYKIKDIKKFYCSGGGWETCGDLRLDITLQDGTNTTIKNFKYS